MRQRKRTEKTVTEIKTLSAFIELHFDHIKKYLIRAVSRRYHYNKEDFVINGLEKCYRKEKLYKGPLELADVKRWCKRVVLNEAYDHVYRTDRRRVLIESFVTDAYLERYIEQSPAHKYQVQDSLNHCIRIIHTMGDSHKEALACKLLGETPKHSATVYQFRKKIDRQLGIDRL